MVHWDQLKINVNEPFIIIIYRTHHARSYACVLFTLYNLHNYTLPLSLHYNIFTEYTLPMRHLLYLQKYPANEPYTDLQNLPNQWAIRSIYKEYAVNEPFAMAHLQPISC